MRGERDKDAESLLGAYGIGRRLATRVVALRAKRVDVTGTLLAEAAQNKAVERLLLAPELVRDVEALSQESLRQLAQQCGYEAPDSLRVVPDPQAGWRTIALEDDLLAEEAVSQAAGEAGVRAMGLVKAGPQQITVRETEKLFTPEEVARLKLSALTSQNADLRVESLRKLVFAPMDGAQKAGIFLNVLIDREAETKVRREAVRSLELIGFRSDMAEAVRGLFEEDKKEAVRAVQRLAALLHDAEASEAALVLAVLLEVFDQSRDGGMLHELLRLIGACSATLVTNYQKTEQFFQSALRHLGRDFDELRFDVEAAIRSCIEQAPDLAADLMQRELRRSTDARVRSLLLNLSESLAREPAQVAELAEQAVRELLNPELPESEKARLRYGLVRLGEPAVFVALGRIAQAGGAERSELIRLIDVLCTESDVSDETVQRAAAALIGLLKVADSVTRRGIVQAALLSDRRVDRSLQEELSGELLTLMTEFNLPSTLDTIENTLERVGAAALRPAYAFMRRTYPSPPAQRAALAMGRIVQNRPEEVPEDLAGQILKLCTALLEDESLGEGAFAITLASLCGYTKPGAERFDASLRRLKDNLWRLPYSLHALQALGIMAGSVNARQEHQKELFELFDGIVRFQARTGMGVRKETEEGPVYEFGREVEFDIRVVPAAVKGLERICVSRQASEQMRTEIGKRFLILWEGVSKVRIIWGPAAIEALVGAMSRAACSPMATLDMKVRLGVSLLRFLNKISVIRSIGEICSQPDGAPPMQKLAVQAGMELLDEWEACELQDVERKLALLKSAGRVAANASLNPRAEAVRALRERTLQALFSGLREGMSEVRDPLLLMRECPGLPVAQKREIDERLSRAFGLMRVGARK
jgi:hypothetical protein